MNNKLLLGVIAILIVSGISVGLLIKNIPVETQNSPGTNIPLEPYVCTADAQMCPDGSFVGRTGPNCQFAACPTSTTSSTVQTTLGQVMTGLNVSITPKELVSDSRCPEDVQCIWAGTVELRTVLSTPVSHGEHVLTLGKPQIFGDYTVTLTDVTPAPKAGVKVPGSSYRFTFDVQKK